MISIHLLVPNQVLIGIVKKMHSKELTHLYPQHLQVNMNQLMALILQRNATKKIMIMENMN